MSVARAVPDYRVADVALEHADVQPLAMLEVKEWRDYRRAKSVARDWIKQHPGLTGYVVVSDFGGANASFPRGYSFRVDGDKVQEIRLEDADAGIARYRAECDTRARAMEDARRAARKQHLRHPQCPSCHCEKRPT